MRQPIKKTGAYAPTPLPAKRSAFRRVRDGAPGSTPGAGARKGQRATTLPAPIGGGTRRNPKRLADPKAMIKRNNDGDGLKGGMQSNETQGRARRGKRKRKPDATSGPAGSAKRGPRSGESLPLCALSVRSLAPKGGVSRLRPMGCARGATSDRGRRTSTVVAALSEKRPRPGAGVRMSDSETGASVRAWRHVSDARKGEERPRRAQGEDRASVGAVPARPEAAKPDRAGRNPPQSNFTRQGRGDHSAGGNAEDGVGAPKRKP